MVGWMVGWQMDFHDFQLNLELGQMFSGQNCFGGRKQSAVIVQKPKGNSILALLKRRVSDMGCLGLPWAALGLVVVGGYTDTS